MFFFPIPKIHLPAAIGTDVRCISPTLTTIKILESFVGKRILEHVVGQPNARQCGRIKGMSTPYASVDLLRHWHQATDECKRLFCCICLQPAMAAGVNLCETLPLPDIVKVIGQR